jgi:hypothetical protein
LKNSKSLSGIMEGLCYNSKELLVEHLDVADNTFEFLMDTLGKVAVAGLHVSQHCKKQEELISFFASLKLLLEDRTFRFAFWDEGEMQVIMEEILRGYVTGTNDVVACDVFHVNMDFDAKRIIFEPSFVFEGRSITLKMTVRTALCMVENYDEDDEQDRTHEMEILVDCTSVPHYHEHA